MKLFLAGDVMTGRGIDQILPRVCPPRLREPVVTSAVDYVDMARRASGSIPSPVDYTYIWGDALQVLDEMGPALRIINLETSVTLSEDYAPKGIHYRMHPGNTGVLVAAGIDACVLANNHVMDWGTSGLLETLDTLKSAGIRTAGAGGELRRARAPAVLEKGADGRLLLFAFCTRDSGVPSDWAAGAGKPGVDLLPNLSSRTVAAIARRVEAVRKPGDLVVASIHWGGNWGYTVPKSHRSFAHGLIEEAGVHLLHGHSSHHPMGMEVHQGHLILYGCGDFLNDYEGIPGLPRYRSDLVLMYLPTLDGDSGELLELELIPFQIRCFQLRHPSEGDRRWLQRRLHRECVRLGSGVEDRGVGFRLSW